jgi:hypothetical protein
MLRNLVCLLALLAVSGAALVAAQEPPVAELIKKLEAENFAERQAASDELVKRGKAALPALAEAARSESAETVTRALDVLRQQLEGKDAELAAAAKDSLEKLAKGEGAAAKRAAEMLKPKATAAPQLAVPMAVPLAPGIRVFGGGFGGGAIRIAAAAADGGGRKVSMKDVDGIKEINVVEGDRTIKINDDPAKGIKVQVTEKKDGKEETKQYEAKSAAELKEKHPAAHKLYEEYKSGGIAIRFEALPVLPALPGGFAPAPMPAIAPPMRVAPAALIVNVKDFNERLDKAQRQLDEATAKLKKLASNDAADIKSILESLEQSKKELAEARAKVLTP